MDWHVEMRYNNEETMQFGQVLPYLCEMEAWEDSYRGAVQCIIPYNIDACQPPQHQITYISGISEPNPMISSLLSRIFYAIQGHILCLNDFTTGSMRDYVEGVSN